mmetsp:Transcript_11836/g.37835  ORF Transcript_11836/g.37835 Transcript_11836/m.37835 type:complete len:382 (+) Transcript_11836:384-1529(+)
MEHRDPLRGGGDDDADGSRVEAPGGLGRRRFGLLLLLLLLAAAARLLLAAARRVREGRLVEVADVVGFFVHDLLRGLAVTPQRLRRLVALGVGRVLALELLDRRRRALELVDAHALERRRRRVVVDVRRREGRHHGRLPRRELVARRRVDPRRERRAPEALRAHARHGLVLGRRPGHAHAAARNLVALGVVAPVADDDVSGFDVRVEVELPGAEGLADEHARLAVREVVVVDHRGESPAVRDGDGVHGRARGPDAPRLVLGGLGERLGELGRHARARGHADHREDDVGVPNKMILPIMALREVGAHLVGVRDGDELRELRFDVDGAEPRPPLEELIIILNRMARRHRRQDARPGTRGLMHKQPEIHRRRVEILAVAVHHLE